MKDEKKHKRRGGRLSRSAMMFAGRVGIRKYDASFVEAHKEAIVTAWSRLFLEGRSSTWSPRNILPSMFVKGEAEYRERERLMHTIDDVIRRCSIWRT